MSTRPPHVSIGPLPTVFELSRPGRRGPLPPPIEPGLPPLEECIPERFLRKGPIQLPEIGELQAVRHYTRLSTQNFAIDNTFYPLGSCTMKYNPRLNEVAAAKPGFAFAHPLYKASEVQGLLEALHALGEILAEVSGLAHVSLEPAAGAHGELTALMMIKAYHVERNDRARTTVLIPDSAHGTNPSSCTIAGFKTREVKSGRDGTVDLDDLRAKLRPDVAGMMLTNPNTLGIFEHGIVRLSDLLHDAGALLYMDGANMNAILGIARPGDFGVDVMHFNLHKTFSTPHGGGGPGAGPIAVNDKLEPFLPVPRLVKREDGSFDLSGEHPRAIGKVRSYFGNTGILLRALAYAWAHGPEDLRAVSEHAVLNANYIRAGLGGAYHLPYGTPSMHEVVFSAKKQKQFSIRALDIAKRLIDLGFHPPTIYFPLIVPEALMIEPTETEARETLDEFIEAMRRIAREAEESPGLLHDAPVTQPVKRLDEVNAVKTPILVCPCEPAAPEG
ncbi:MAG TPA: aminomethyl-transferring glycine dehydrogenase subunit GcvPB [Planctomycetota bacterium]|nr:aminomethyl-transferring glycine dehydrogenase subunit GcvPB [Planctomycetota bacterium]